MQSKRLYELLPIVSLCLMTLSVHAAVIDYTATGVVEQVDNGSALLPTGLADAGVGDKFTFDFSVDTTTVGSGTADDTSYLGAVRAASYSFGGTSMNFGVDANAVEILNNVAGFSGYFMSAGDVVDADFTGTAASFSLVTLAYSLSGAPLGFYKNTSLSNAPLTSKQANQEDDMALSFASYVNGTEQSSSGLLIGPLSLKRTAGPVQAPEIGQASAATGLTLLAGCVLVLRGRRRAAIPS